MKVLISGIGGFMGREVLKLCKNGFKGACAVCGVDAFAEGDVEGVKTFKTFDEVDVDVDCIIDFSHHSCTKALLDYAVANGITTIVATTGQTEEERQMIDDAAEKIPLFFAANYSLGVALLIELAKKAAYAMPEAEIEIIEVHHDRKIDAPSGTALAIANAIKEDRADAPLKCGRSGQCKRTPREIGIHAVRYGNVVGQHEVIIATQSQTIKLKHEAHERALFAEGALAAAEFMTSGRKDNGLYNMNDLING